ncbi:MAG: 1-acyl-sn-glycerol-3-phosphate acyltransferase [Firmicutes bacterium]|nr:1-acyl-sn-glycerol-3-phosphate acyltransferase [Bacillota bacterium]
MKQTLERKLDKYIVKKPKKWAHWLLIFIVFWRLKRKHNLKIDYQLDMRKEKEQFLLLSNHPSRLDPFYTCRAIQPKMLNMFANRYFFHWCIPGYLLKQVGGIPTKLYQADVGALKNFYRSVEKGRNVGIMIEGINSVNGEYMGMAQGTAKLVKKIGLPIISHRIDGAFLTNAKWRKGEIRKGKVVLTARKLISKEDLAKLSVEEVEDLLNKEFYFDDFKWSKENNIEWKGGDLATNINYALYFCPKCKSEFEIVSHDNKIYCPKCGNGASINKDYSISPLNEDDIIPESISKWYNLQREDVFIKLKLMNEEVGNKGNEDCKISHQLIESVQLFMWNKSGRKEVCVGEGTLTLDKDYLSYISEKGHEVSLQIPLKNVPAVPLNYNEGIEIFHGEHYLFKFKDNPLHSTKWAIIIEQNFKLIHATA